MNISIASDHAGFEQKTALAAYLRELGHRVTDLGPDNDERVDYPDFAALVARDVAAGAAEALRRLRQGRVRRVRRGGDLLCRGPGQKGAVP